VAFVVTDGQLSAIGQPIQGTGLGFAVRRGVKLGPELALTYGQIYESQPAVRMVVDFLARGAASMAVQTFKRVSDTDRKRLAPPDSPMAYLLEVAANPTTTGYRLIHGLISDRAIYDAAFWLKIRPGGPGSATAPGYLRRIPPARVVPIGGDWFEVDAYRILGNKGYLDVAAADMVAFTGYHPSDVRIGMSPIESIRTILAEEYAATEARAALWRSGWLASGWVKRPIEAPEWSDPARQRFEADFAAYQLTGPKSGGSPVFEDGMSWEQAGYSPKDAQYVESRRLTREETAAAYHIAPPLVGILEHATFSNIKEQHIGYYVDTLGPWTTSTEQEINVQLVPDFYPGARTGKVYVEFNINAKLKGDFEQQAAQLTTAIGGPYMTPNEGRARINLPSIEGGDELIRPLNVTTGAQASPADSAPQPGDVNPNNPNEPAPPKADELGRRTVRKAAPASDVDAHVAAFTALYERQRKSVLGKYAAAKAGRAGAKATPPEVHDVFDINRWSTEFGVDLYKLALPLSATVGYDVARQLTGDSGGYDPTLTLNYLAAQTSGTSASVNTVTRNEVAAALTAHDVEAALAAVFATAIAVRALSGGRAQATAVSSWSTYEAGRQYGQPARKRWVTGAHPRESHAAMNGQTVGLDDKFSNGARWPADAINLGVDEVAGCNCDLVIIPEGVSE
jgi:HK97 family phage portal protein